MSKKDRKLSKKMKRAGLGKTWWKQVTKQIDGMIYKGKRFSSKEAYEKTKSKFMENYEKIYKK